MTLSLNLIRIKKNSLFIKNSKNYKTQNVLQRPTIFGNKIKIYKGYLEKIKYVKTK